MVITEAKVIVIGYIGGISIYMNYRINKTKNMRPWLQLH